MESPLPSPERLNAVQDFGRRGYAQADAERGHPWTPQNGVEGNFQARVVRTLKRADLYDNIKGELKRGWGYRW